MKRRGKAQKHLGDKPPSTFRSALMAKVRGKDTKPEKIVRHTFHRRGYRFRLHRKDLPGSPDIVFSKNKLAVFVHGCFWHRHKGCARTSIPKTRAKFWADKFAANVARDKRSIAALRKLGWRTFVIWECQTNDVGWLELKIEKLMAYTPGQSVRTARHLK